MLVEGVNNAARREVTYSCAFPHYIQQPNRLLRGLPLLCRISKFLGVVLKSTVDGISSSAAIVATDLRRRAFFPTDGVGVAMVSTDCNGVTDFPSMIAATGCSKPANCWPRFLLI